VEDVRDPHCSKGPSREGKQQRRRFDQGGIEPAGDRETGERRHGERRMTDHAAGHAGTREGGRWDTERGRLDALAAGTPPVVPVGHEAEGVAGYRRHDGHLEPPVLEAGDRLAQPRLGGTDFRVVILGDEEKS
jgi:hypothetical protein